MISQLVAMMAMLGNYDPNIYEEKDGSQQPCYVKGSGDRV